MLNVTKFGTYIYIFVGSLVGLKEVNRSVKTNTQTFIKFNMRHYRSDLAALPDSGTAASADNFESQFKISVCKLESGKFLSFL